MFTAARLAVAPVVAAVPADRTAVKRCVVPAAARVRPTRSGTPAWRSSPRLARLGRGVVALSAAAGKAGDETDGPADETNEEAVGRLRDEENPGRLANESNGESNGKSKTSNSALVFGRSAKTLGSQCKPPGSVLHAAPVKPSDPAMHRAGKAALVSIAALFGAAGAARAAQTMARPSSSSSSMSSCIPSGAKYSSVHEYHHRD